MNSPPGPASNTAATAHVAKYEEIRSYAVERLAFAGRHGLAVLLGQGLAAWIEQWSKIPEPQPCPTTIPENESIEPFPLPDEASVEVVHVLTTMTLVHIQKEGYA